MLDTKKAFPSSFSSANEGMHLRDFFAATVIPQVVSSNLHVFDETEIKRVARIAYEIADAMMEERTVAK